MVLQGQMVYLPLNNSVISKVKNMGDLKNELEKMEVTLLKGSYFSNAYNQEVVKKREDFLKAVETFGVKGVWHNDLSDLRISAVEKANMMATYPYLTEDDFEKDGGNMYKLDKEEFIFGVGPITVRFVEFGE